MSGRALNRDDPHASGIWSFEDLSSQRPVRAELTGREREVAARLGREFVDLDDMIAERAGKPLPDEFKPREERGPAKTAAADGVSAAAR